MTKILKSLLAADNITKDIVEKTDESEMNALAIAACKGQKECVEALLLSDKVTTNMVEHAIYDALTLAARNGHADCIEALLRSDKITKNMTKPNNTNICWDAINIAANRGHAKCLILLLTSDKTRHIDTRDPIAKGLVAEAMSQSIYHSIHSRLSENVNSLLLYYEDRDNIKYEKAFSLLEDYSKNQTLLPRMFQSRHHVQFAARLVKQLKANPKLTYQYICDEITTYTAKANIDPKGHFWKMICDLTLTDPASPTPQAKR